MRPRSTLNDALRREETLKTSRHNVRILHEGAVCLRTVTRNGVAEGAWHTHGGWSVMEFEVVICENGGAEAHFNLNSRIPAYLSNGKPIHLLCAPENLGFAGGVNMCIEHARENVAWWILNPDTIPQSNAMSQLAERLKTGECDAVGCTLELPNGKIQSHGGQWRQWFGRAVSIGWGSHNYLPFDAAKIERDQNYLNGASMMVSRRFLEEAGLLREDYFLYCEEVEWCIRARSRGLILGFAPFARVLHHQGSTTGAGGEVKKRPRIPVYLDARNRILLTRDCFPWCLPVVALSGLALIAWTYGRRSAWTQVGHALMGWVAGLRDERGPPPFLRQEISGRPSARQPST